MGKVISLQNSVKYRPLTSAMLTTLRSAYIKQQNDEPFGQTTLSGSFTGLLNRGFIDLKITTHNGIKQRSWYVTTMGINALKRLNLSI